MDIEKHLICPLCQKSLFRLDSTIKCENGHCFDLAKSGYINLLNPGKKNNAKAGDGKDMIRARTQFFSTGAYSKIRDTLCSIVSSLAPSVIVDAGCGEGYYTSRLADDNKSSLVYGFDMSKFGTEHASKISKSKQITNTLYAVSNIFDMPLEGGCADIIVNMFAPVASEEFYRVLRNGGYLIIGVAGKSHLEGLKRALYDEIYLNEGGVDSYEGFELIERRGLRYVASIFGNEAIRALFQMTPYYHRTSLEDKAKLDSLDSLTTEVEVDFLIFKKI